MPHFSYWKDFCASLTKVILRYSKDLIFSYVSRHFTFSNVSGNRKTTKSLEKIIIFKGFCHCETQPPASIGWVALSSVVVCRRASVTSPLISTIWCFRAYKPYILCEDMILATFQCQHIFCCWVEPSLLLSSYHLSHLSQLGFCPSA